MANLRDVHLKVVPINGSGAEQDRADALHFLVLFEDAQPAAPARGSGEKPQDRRERTGWGENAQARVARGRMPA